MIGRVANLRIDQIRARRDQDRVAIGGLARHVFGSDHTGRARTIFNDGGDSFRCANLSGNQPGDKVGAGARGNRNDKADRSGRES